MMDCASKSRERASRSYSRARRGDGGEWKEWLRCRPIGLSRGRGLPSSGSMDGRGRGGLGGLLKGLGHEDIDDEGDVRGYGAWEGCGGEHVALKGVQTRYIGPLGT